MTSRAQQNENQDTVEQVEQLRSVVEQLSRTLMQQQDAAEQHLRWNENSGLKQVRHRREGTRSYDSTSTVDWSFAAIHDHANFRRTLGMGEVVAVLNGVEFLTRHNDYLMRMPSSTSSEYQATEDVPYPQVPPQVAAAGGVAEQIVEMREWFRAWRDQDYSERDYRPYFKPVLCYMEGMWTDVGDSIDEPFTSRRHSIDAATWLELNRKNRYSAYTGAMQPGENLAVLPRRVFNITDEGLPQFAQWNYNILCQPLKDDLPLDRLRLADMLSVRMRSKASLTQMESQRLARFQVNKVDQPFRYGSAGFRNLLDSLMNQVPGKNGPSAQFTDTGFGWKPFEDVDGGELNAGFYHRRYVQIGNRFRGYSDPNVYMAKTNQSKVAGICQVNDAHCDGELERWTYAIPLEIVYLTPLQSWNPYNVTDVGEGGVTGRGTEDDPLTGVGDRNFFLTPAQFFSNDTPPKVYVKDGDGVARGHVASGLRIILQNIEGVGQLRQRYPIAPLTVEGSTYWKELEALREVALDPMGLGKMLENPISAETLGSCNGERHVFTTSTSKFRPHAHRVVLTDGQYQTLAAEGSVWVTTEEADDHKHSMLVFAYRGDRSRLRSSLCDGIADWCVGHNPWLYPISDI